MRSKPVRAALKAEFLGALDSGTAAATLTAPGKVPVAKGRGAG